MELFTTRPGGDALALTVWGSLSSWTLTALPLFIWMGEILFRTRLSQDMHAFGAEPPVTRDDVLAGWKQRNSRDGRLMLHASPGCKECDETGFKGRAGIHELMVVSREVRRMIQTRAPAETLQRIAMAEGMRTLRQDGIDKVLDGVTTIEEVRATSNV